MAMRWYAVHTLNGSEERARQALEQRIRTHNLTDRFGQVLVPSETVIDPKTKRKTTRRFYPGYMLVEMELDNETWHLVEALPPAQLHALEQRLLRDGLDDEAVAVRDLIDYPPDDADT